MEKLCCYPELQAILVSLLRSENYACQTMPRLVLLWNLVASDYIWTSFINLKLTQYTTYTLIFRSQPVDLVVASDVGRVPVVDPCV